MPAGKHKIILVYYQTIVKGKMTKKVFFGAVNSQFLFSPLSMTLIISVASNTVPSVNRPVIVIRLHQSLDCRKAVTDTPYGGSGTDITGRGVGNEGPGPIVVKLQIVPVVLPHLLTSSIRQKYVVP